MNGARLAYDEAGEGPALVFLHAGVFDRTMWDPQFADLARDHRLVRYDFRGFGASDLPAEDFSSRDDLYELLGLIDVDRATIVGSSMGGSVALDVALERPTLVRGLVLIGSGVSGNVPSAELRAELATIEETIEKGEVGAGVERQLRLWLDGRRARGYVGGALRERMRSLNRAQAERELAWLRSGKPFPNPKRLQRPGLERLEEVRLPTLVIVGADDVPDVVATARLLAARILGARLEVVEDAAHLPNLEHPERVTHLLRDFLGSL